jgi:hypothetical protein
LRNSIKHTRGIKHEACQLLSTQEHQLRLRNAGVNYLRGSEKEYMVG